MEKDEGNDFDHTLIDDSSAQGVEKKDYSVGEENSNMRATFPHSSSLIFLSKEGTF